MPAALRLRLWPGRAWRPAHAELAIEVEQRPGIVAHEAEARHDFARRLLLLDLFGQEPLQLGHLREGLAPEGQLVEVVDLRRRAFFLLKDALEDVAEGVELERWLLERCELDVAVAGQDEVEELHRVVVLFDALQPQPARGAGEFLALAERG